MPRTTRRARASPAGTASRASWRSSTVVDVLAAGGDDQVAAPEPGAGAGATVLDQADEQSVPLGEADRAPQLAGHVGRRQPDAEAAGNGDLAGRQVAQAVPQRLIGREGEVEALAEAVGVQADDPTLTVDDGAARRAAAQGGGVLEAAADATAAGAAEGAVGGADRAGGHADATVAEAADGVDGLAEVGRAAPLDDGSVAGVDPDDGEVAVDVVAGDGARLLAAVGEAHGDLRAAEVVGVGDDGAGLDDDATAAATVAADAHDGGADPVGGLAGGVLDA